MLEKHKVLKKVRKNIFTTGIDIIVDSNDFYINSDIKSLYYSDRTIKDFFSDYVYDMKNKLIYNIDYYNNIAKSSGTITLIKPRKSDLDKFSYGYIFSKFTPSKIKKISKRLMDKLL